MGEIYDNPIIVKDLSTLLSAMNRSSRQKINKETLDLNHILGQIDRTDIKRTFHPTEAEYTFISGAHGTFSRIDHVGEHKISLGKFKKNEIIPSIFSGHNGMKLELNKRKGGKSTNM